MCSRPCNRSRQRGGAGRLLGQSDPQGHQHPLADAPARLRAGLRPAGAGRHALLPLGEGQLPGEARAAGAPFGGGRGRAGGGGGGGEEASGVRRGGEGGRQVRGALPRIGVVLGTMPAMSVLHLRGITRPCTTKSNLKKIVFQLFSPLRPSVGLSSQSINIASAATAMERRERGKPWQCLCKKRKTAKPLPERSFFSSFRPLVARGAPGIDSGGASQAGGEEKTTGSQGGGAFEVAPFHPACRKIWPSSFFIPFFLPCFFCCLPLEMRCLVLRKGGRGLFARIRSSFLN